MKKSIRESLIIIYIIFLVAVIGGSWLLHHYFADQYYIYKKSQIMEKAFYNLGNINISNLTKKDEKYFEKYENNNFKFVIADEGFNTIYTTNSDYRRNQVERYIVKKAKKFESKPKVKHIERNADLLILRGKILYKETTYYVYIREDIGAAKNSFKYTDQFFLVMLIISILFGSILLGRFGKKIVISIEKINMGAKRIAKREFFGKVSINTNFYEINELADSINDMSAQIEDYVKKLEDEKNFLQKENESKERLDKMRKEFIGNVSHQLKTPIAIIATQLELLEYIDNEEEKKYYYASIVEETDKMSKMVDNLLKLMTLEHELDNVEMKEFNLSDTVKKQILEYAPIFLKKQIQLKSEIEDNLYIKGNKEYIEQALDNYIMNALKHTDNGKSIEIRLYNHKENAKIEVINEGKNIDEEKLDTIWKSYFSLNDDADNNMTVGNSGLGLYIVNSIVNIHNGKCGVVNLDGSVKFFMQFNLS